MNVPIHFASLPDYRVAGRCLHQLGDILGLVLSGTIADCDDFSEIEDYGKEHITFLQEQLGFSFANGMPCEDTLNRLVRRIKAKELAACFKSCLQAISLAGKHLSIDGKELRGTIASGSKPALVRMVNVWVEEYKLSFGQFEAEKRVMR